VLQDLVEQLVQLEDEEALMRLEPPPIPKQEIIFRTSGEPHASHTTSFSFPAVTRHSNLWPHFWQEYSYRGISLPFYLKLSAWSTGLASSRGHVP